MSTAPAPLAGPELGPLGWARWAWRLLTSMRTALILLFLLALAAVPGSLLPQRGVDAGAVATYRDENPTLFRIWDALSLFDVFSSPWFSAVYLLLFVSLVGCVVPRSRLHWRASRARPPAAPRNFARLPEHRTISTAADPATALASARRELRRRRYRVDTTSQDDGGGTVSAERGHLRETGNLVFHLSLILILIGVAVGNQFGYNANIVVREGAGFVNVDGAYDTMTGGPRFDAADLEPFSVTLDDFDVTYQVGGSQAGAPRSFRAEVTYVEQPGDEPRTAVVASNKPLVLDGDKVFLTGNGYAPVLTVRDGDGNIVQDGSVPFLPQDGNLTSTGVVKMPDAVNADGDNVGVGLVGQLLPTYAETIKGIPVSAAPDDIDPVVLLTAYTGDLGLDDGSPQSVYRLDTDQGDLEQLNAEDGQPFRTALRPGDKVALPGGNGTVTFERVERFVNFKVARDPGTTPALVGSVLALAGLMASLFVRRRRVWIRVAAGDGGRTVVEVAGLSRTEEDGLGAHLEEVAGSLTEALDGDPDSGDPDSGDPDGGHPDSDDPGTSEPGHGDPGDHPGSDDPGTDNPHGGLVDDVAHDRSAPPAVRPREHA